VSATPRSLRNLFPLPNGSGLLETYNINNAPVSLRSRGTLQQQPLEVAKGCQRLASTGKCSRR
jgi:hypothetical protein